MKIFRIATVLILLISLGSCATKLSDKANKDTQEQVKKEVMQSLEEYYKQPFKLEKFNYEYKTDYGDVSGNHPSVTYGQYSFKVRAMNNPIIITNFYINDGDTKESIKGLIDSFKKNQLNSIYCMGLTKYYRYVNNNNKILKQPYTEQAEKYCDSVGQDRYKMYKEYYLKHHTS
ncbi:hypothetical protein LO80_01515 [Candidatus Francisella endociliophora]|uniref:Lipoprotein n=1 Tax=Candidatus Francisella endociliophora TaxID=653937 RepID=A0A097EMI6_9GAMM|nr:hypothetical protein [Francisella sp. FSC1006]AIT08782.1 hypothetical protein LO80_01515 [Francisella sp. FSC1006]